MKISLFFISILFLQIAFAQKKLPIIMANSEDVAINDGGYLDKNAWFLSPATKPDIYTADRCRKTKWVTFYTDIDSIKVKVKPGTKFDFIILLHQKDSCYTRVVSSFDEKKISSNNDQDTIPFKLTAYNAIQVTAIINDRDTVNLHLDLSTLDFRLTKEAILKKTKLLTNQPDALSGKTNPDFSHLEQVFKIQMGNLVWLNPAFSPANMAAHDMDGRFGYRVFEGKIIEIDYDNNLIILHSKLPKIPKGYARSEIKFIRSLFCIEADIEVDHHLYKGNFLFDNGSDQAMVIDSAWAVRQNFPKDLKMIKTLTFKDGAGRSYDTKIVSVPFLHINGFKLADIPTSLLSNTSPVGDEINILGNDLLKRFNTIVDLRKDYIYLKINELKNLVYRG